MKQFKKAINTSLLLACLATSLGLDVQQSAMALQVDVPYQWILQLETKDLPKQFEYKGSTLKPVDKVEVRYSPAKNEGDKKLYEYLWYHDGKPLGLERNRKFDLPKGEGIAIRVLHKNNSTTGEKKAAANAILRIALDAYLNKNAVALVRLPSTSFTEISGYLQNQGLQVAPDTNKGPGLEIPLKSSLILSVVSEPDGLKQVLYLP